MQEIIFKPNDSASVLVVGDIILDQYIYGETSRISPEAPVPVVRVSHTEERPGGAANVAVNASALGINVKLLGITGNDEASNRLENILKQRGVNCHFIYQTEFPTITKQRVLSRHQQLIRLDYEHESYKINLDKFIDRYKELIESADIVILSDYAKGSLKKIESLIHSANQKGIPVLVDPKSKDFICYSHSSIITPNLEEFEAIVGECKSNEQLLSKGKALCASLKLDALLITRGENGMTLLSQDKEPFHLATQAHEVYDVTGAGDTVIAVLGAAIASEYGIEQATTLANLAAGLVVEKLGTATVSVDEINHANNRNKNPFGVADEKTAERLINKAKRNGEKIIMTNGCFDILHAGHIDYLSEAKSLGDRLVVAVNDDDSVKRLKGNTRPVNSLPNRMKVLNALDSVDLVVSFSENTPERLIALLEPDVLVKGGDYKEEQIAGASYVKEKGGELIILPYIEGCSTSLILEKMKKDSQEISC